MRERVPQGVLYISYIVAEHMIQRSNARGMTPLVVCAVRSLTSRAAERAYAAFTTFSNADTPPDHFL